MTVNVAIKVLRISTEIQDDNYNQVVYDSINWVDIEDHVNLTLPESYYCKIEDA